MLWWSYHTTAKAKEPAACILCAVSARDNAAQSSVNLQSIDPHALFDCLTDPPGRLGATGCGLRAVRSMGEGATRPKARLANRLAGLRLFAGGGPARQLRLARQLARRALGHVQRQNLGLLRLAGHPSTGWPETPVASSGAKRRAGGLQGGGLPDTTSSQQSVSGNATRCRRPRCHRCRGRSDTRRSPAVLRRCH